MGTYASGCRISTSSGTKNMGESKGENSCDHQRKIPFPIDQVMHPAKNSKKRGIVNESKGKTGVINKGKRNFLFRALQIDASGRKLEGMRAVKGETRPRMSKTAAAVSKETENRFSVFPIRPRRSQYRNSSASPSVSISNSFRGLPGLRNASITKTLSPWSHQQSKHPLLIFPAQTSLQHRFHCIQHV